MKSIIKRFFLFAMTIASQNVFADTDVTRLYLKNSGFDTNFNYDKNATGNVAQEILNIDGWVNDNTVKYTVTGVYEFGTAKTFNATGKIPSSGIDGSRGCAAFSTGWGESLKYHQDVSLPSGSFKLLSAFYNGSVKTAGESLVGWIPSSGTSALSKIKSFPLNQWITEEIAFTLTKATKGKIQIGFKAAAEASSNSAMVVLDYVRLIMTDDAAARDCAKAVLNELIATANSAYGDGTNNGAAELKAAIDASISVIADDANTFDSILDSKDALEMALEKFYAQNISLDHPQDQTSRITNPSFEDGFTGWTQENMQRQSNSSFSLKEGTYYVEKWVSSGSVGDGCVQQHISNLPNGIYILKAAAQNITQQSSIKRTGAVIFAGEAETEVNNRNTYSLQFTNIEGETTIGFRAINATGNWICIDNFQLLYCAGGIDDYKAELSVRIAEAEELSSQTMAINIKEQLNIAIEQARAAQSEEDITASARALTMATKAAQTSIASFSILQKVIDEAESVFDPTAEGADKLRTTIDSAKALMNITDVTDAQLTEAAAQLETAIFLFHVANGTGTAPKVTTNTSFFIPSAHGALIRATISGANIIERGVCWSTEHEPTVEDNRSTDYFNQKGLLFHVKTMKPAQVYYARPYAVNKTYAVGYGDEIKIVTLPQGSCVGTWDGGAPTAEANERCSTAIQQTMDYLNEWTAIKGFRLSGHYGAQTPTADCSYGGWMRIGPNAGNQAIGTVIHETGHGVGVGTHWRWNNCADTREHTTHGKWLGSWANKTLQFLENSTSDDVFMTGDAVHGWGQNATYDWFVNGADKDTHQDIQYIGGCALLYSLYVDGLCPTSGHPNGVAGYTFNFDDSKRYYIKSEDAERGLADGFLYQRAAAAVAWKNEYYLNELSDSAAWYLEYVPTQGLYRFRNAATGRYLSRNSSGSIMLKNTSSPGNSESFQLMPGRNKITVKGGVGRYTALSYWFTWQNNGNKAMQLNALNSRLGYGTPSIEDFDYSNNATTQRYLIISEDDIEAFERAALPTGVENINQESINKSEERKVYSLDGRVITTITSEGNPLRALSRGIYIIDGRKVVIR